MALKVSKKEAQSNVLSHAGPLLPQRKELANPICEIKLDTIKEWTPNLSEKWMHYFTHERPEFWMILQYVSF